MCSGAGAGSRRPDCSSCRITSAAMASANGAVPAARSGPATSGSAVGVPTAAGARLRSFPVCVLVTWTRRFCGSICEMLTKHRKVFSKTSTYVTVIEPERTDN